MTATASTAIDRNRLPHIFAAAIFGVSAFVLAVLLNLHWPGNGETERNLAISVSILCFTAWGVMHLAKPEETQRT